MITSARLFFQQQFPELPCPGKVDTQEDRHIQQQLIADLEHSSTAPNLQLQAERCLRCYISHQILYVCINLQTKFGQDHGFNLDDVLGIVLNDVDLSQSIFNSSGGASFLPFAADVLKTFNPQVSSLSTWASMLTRQQSELNDFLLEHGIIQQSNWSLLNEKTPDDLQRILSETFGLPTGVIHKFCILLKSYHAVYRRDRRGSRGRCKPPSEAQLQEIHQISELPLSPTGILDHLIEIADYLRQYRLFNKGKLSSVSIDNPDTSPALDMRISAGEDTGVSNDSEARQRLYGLIHACLDQAIQEAIDQRYCYLQKQSSEKACQYKLALKLYCCDQRTMADIAVAVGLSAQWQVTRLLKLDDFLATIRRQLIKHLHDQLTTYIQSEEFTDGYLCTNRLQHLDETHLAALIDKPRANSTANGSSSHFFMQRLCNIIQQF
jgi:hypothetical protein